MSVPASSALATDSAAPPLIRRLDPLVVNQIAAGEVVERPAAVVRELLDNALDAGASRVEVELEHGGIELVRVSDDGCGIGADQLMLAVEPHATSKVRTAEDLTRVGTLGFRGEALASIASVSRLAIRSRRAGEGGANEVRVEGGEASAIRPASGAVGTSVSVRNLFFNTPARRKFLRTQGTEQQHCVDAVKRAALAHPRIGFTLRCDGRVTLEAPGGQGPRDRVFTVLGRESSDQYLEMHADRFDDARGLALWGLIGRPVLAKPNIKHQHVFLNGRYVRDRTIQHALREACRGLIEPGRHPAAMVMIEMDPSAVDVNVHPAKLEVRFRDGSLVHSVVLRAAQEALRAADLTPSDAGARERGIRFEAATPRESPGPGTGAPAAERFVAWFEREGRAAATRRFDFDSARAAIDAADTEAGATAMPPAHAAPAEAPGVRTEADTATPHPVDASPHAPGVKHLQVHNSFVVTEDEGGLVIVDQHALHERAMYESLHRRVSAGPLQSQRMLVPVVVSASASQQEALSVRSALLERLGIELEPAGPAGIAVQGFAVFLMERGVEPGEFVESLVESAESLAEAGAEEALLHEVLDMMACKAAIKAGDRLSEQELSELLAMRETIERSSACPHGRPTAIRLTMAELERQFGRR
ncbi:MAG: DNA mismatch repair endonuclease MutL [Planctomycetota bacterium]